MSNGPKNFSQAIDELENGNQSNGYGFRELEDTLKKLKPQLDNLSQQIEGEARKAKDKIENEVQKNPWAAVGIAGLIFFVLGFLLARRKD